MEKQPPRKVLDRVRGVARRKHYSIRTEGACVNRVKRYILFHDKRQLKEMGVTEIEAFLTHLAKNRTVAATTQNQAYSALLFLYREVLRLELDAPINALRAKKLRRLPTVLTRDEALLLTVRFEYERQIQFPQ